MLVLRKLRSALIYYLSMLQLKAKGRLQENAIYLTFDDGPEPGITEFVLDELAKHKAKATFFCAGKNIEKYPELLRRILAESHSIGSHTYSHINAHRVSCRQYLDDVKRFDEQLNTPLFRPPWGALTLRTFFSLRKKKNIVLWHLSSDDFSQEKFNLSHSLEQLKKGTKQGVIVLFHFCHRHENETRQILPLYLDWLDSQKYQLLPL